MKREADMKGGNPLQNQAQRKQAGACVVVTGAAGGIGAAVARRLHDDGWHVVATDLCAAALSEALQTSPRMSLATLDVARPDSVAQLAEHLHSSLPAGVAGLVNVAGVLQDVRALLDMDDDAARRIWEVNYFGAERCMKALAPAMIAGGGGSVVNITSINELQPLPLHAYAPSKVALGALTRLAAGEFGPAGVRVNAVAPGFTLTPIFRDKLDSGKRDAGMIEQHTAMGRLVETSEIASAVSFLIGDDASAITGISLPVDCGWLASAHWMNFRQLGAA
ncbi:SDR family NAD(P)-dependent oxidoreductase [Bordetella trematum]|uniref:SDR family NAD(P)-dependent oxidoreductase n=1 Tax=Bordetella trematum TaxID=123899 RepID=UPI0013FD6439|nr:SDR family oxidoreductase [Bordetella trematum]